MGWGGRRREDAHPEMQRRGAPADGGDGQQAQPAPGNQPAATQRRSWAPQDHNAVGVGDSRWDRVTVEGERDGGSGADRAGARWCDGRRWREPTRGGDVSAWWRQGHAPSPAQLLSGCQSRQNMEHANFWEPKEGAFKS